MQLGPGPHEHLAIKRQNPHLFCRQIKAVPPFPQGFNPGEQGRVGGDFRGESRKLGGQIALERLAIGRAIGPGKIVKHPRNAVERAFGKLQRLDCIGKIGGFGVFGNRGNRGTGLGQTLIEGGGEIGVGDLGERRQRELGGPVGQKRVGHGVLLCLAS